MLAVLFHCNTFHRSNPNLTEEPRWALVTCYCAVDNPTVGHGLPVPHTTPPLTLPRAALEPMAAEELVGIGRRNLARLHEQEGGGAASAKL
eukprot:SAG22_NODE_250_length_13779_cov_6.413450_2_plen_91_part_00